MAKNLLLVTHTVHQQSFTIITKDFISMTV